MSEWEESELTDEEKLMDMVEILQKENEDLKQRLHHLPQPQNMEPLLKTIRQQEQEIGRLNSSLIEEQSQNERLLELAKNEKKLNAENLKLSEKIASLEQQLSQKNAQLHKLSTQAEALEGKFKNLPSNSSIKDFSDTYARAIRVMDSLRWYHIINWGVAVAFAVVVVFNFVGLWMLRSTAKDTLNTTNATQTAVTKGLYAPEGYSVLQGSQSSIEYWNAQQK